MKSKLTIEQWDEVRAKYATGQYSLVDLAVEYGVSKCRIWTHINHGTRSINGGRPKLLSEPVLTEIRQKYSTGLYSHVSLALEYGVGRHVVEYHLKKNK